MAPHGMTHNFMELHKSILHDKDVIHDGYSMIDSVLKYE